MQQYKNLEPVIDGKLIARNFGSIGHIAGSKMKDDADHLLSSEEQAKYIQCKR